MDSSTTGDTVLVGCGTYYEHDIVMKSGPVVRSETGQADCVTIDAQQLGRVFYCDSAWTRLEGLTITGGLASSGAGLYARDCIVELIGCVFAMNMAPGGYGGGMYATSTAGHGGWWGASLSNCTFSGNEARSGGGIFSTTNGFYIANSEFSYNSADDIGGGLCSNDEYFNLDNCTFSFNSALNGGGAYDGYHYGNPSIRGCTFFGNEALERGGGWYSLNMWCCISFSKCTFHSNQAGLQGGGLYFELGYPGLENTIVAFSTQGEAVSCNKGVSLSLICCDLYGNAGGDWVGCAAGKDSINGNFSADPLFCNPDSGDFTLDAASPCLSAPGCGLIGAHGEGCDVAITVASGEHQVPERFYLAQNAPNPFNPMTTIRFGLPRAARVQLTVHDVAGRRVATLADGYHVAGDFSKAWNGRDKTGHEVASGIYLARMEAGRFTATRKMVFLK